MKNNTQNSYISNNLKLSLSRQFNVHISEITKDFMKKLIEIDLSGCNISDISGLEYAVNAIYINLNQNNISDVSKISNLKNLEELELNENKIEDISFINNLKKLKRIGLYNNNISYIPKIKNTNLININLDNNMISDLSEFNKSKFKDTTVLAADQCIILKPIEIDVGKSILFTSNIKWDLDNKVFLDNIQVTGKYDSIYTDSRPSMLYSISEVVVNDIKSNCILKADFYKEDLINFSKVLSGKLIQPIYLNQREAKIDKSTEVDFSKICGYLKTEDDIDNLESNKQSPFKGKTITLINEFGEKLHSKIDKNGKYVFKDIQKGKYTILFPVLSDYVYTSPSVIVLNIDEKGSFIVNSSTKYINSKE